MKVTIDTLRSESSGLEVTNVSVVYDNSRSILMIHGMLLPKPNYSFDDKSVEPEILCSFHDGHGRVLYSTPAHEYISFSLNRYGVFSLEVPGERINVASISEIRLLPYLAKKAERKTFRLFE